MVKELEGKDSHNFNGWYSSTTLNQSSSAIMDPYVPIFSKNIVGANSFEIGIITGIISLTNIFQMFWAKLSEKYGNSKFLAFLGQILSALIYIPMALLHLGEVFVLIIYRAVGPFNSTAPSSPPDTWRS